MRSVLRILLLLAVALPLSRATDAGADDEDDLEEARELYEVGNAHYAAGRYEKAAAAFQKGYRLSKLPGFLYNLANAYERMGEYGKAADRLELYLKSPKAKDVVSVKERVRRLRAAEEDRARELRKQKAAEEERRKLAMRNGEIADEEFRYETDPRSPTYLYFLGGGAAALAVGGVFGLIAQQAGSSAEGGCMGAICDRDAKADLDREKRFALAADVSMGVGIALAGVGAYLYLKGPKRRRVRVDPSDRGIPDRDDEDEGDDDEDEGDDDFGDDDDDVTWAPMVGPDSIGITFVGRF